MQKLKMIPVDRIFAILILAIGCPFLLHSQTNLVIGQTQNVGPGIPTDYTIPAMGGDLVVTLRGGDGGGIRFSGLVCETTVEGGAGATVKATFEVGFGTGQLQPGGTIRAMVGQKGWSDSKACFSGAASYAGGGGSTAILYLPPGADATGINWRLLAVAGAGGGSSRPSTGIDRKGGGATTGDPSGGVNGIAGAYGGANGNYGSDNSFITAARPGAGYLGGSRIPSYAANISGYCDEGLASNCVGYYSMVESANSAVTPILVKLMDNAYYNYTGDRSIYSNSYKNGGNGFTGGGAGSTNVVFGPTGGGGGGGFSGGSVNYYFGGGGGSSHVASGVNTSNISISPGANGASGHHDGFVKMLVNAAPIVTAAKCKNQTVQLNANGTASLAASQLNNGSTGFTPLAFTVNGQSTLNFSCADVGTKVVTLTLTDVYNSTSTCSATITVEDKVGPTASCQDVTVQLNAAGTGFISTCSLDAGSTDACSGFVGYAVSQTTFGCLDVGSNTVTMTVTDINGNANTCTANVIVEDNIRPMALCQDVSVQLDVNGNASVTASAVNNSSSDICGIASYTLDQTNFTCDNFGPNPVLLTVTDVNGNTSSCSATVTVQDNSLPTAACQNVSVQLDANGSASLTAQEVDNGSSDNCGIVDLRLSPTSFTCDNLGFNNATLTVTAKSGLSSTCTASVNVIDNILPTAQCQDLTVQLDESGEVTVDANLFDNGSMDNCSLNRLYFNDFSPSKTFGCNDVGILSLSNIIVQDNAGNVNYCNLTLTIQDNTAPIALCQDISIQLEADGSKVITPADIDKGSSDACGIASLSLAIGDYSCETQGAVTETLTVTDVNGLSSSCTAIVTVEDKVKPALVCQNLTVNFNGEESLPLLPTDIFIAEESYDACGPVTFVSQSQSIIDCAEVGNTLAIEVIAQDPNGNSNTCTAMVTVGGMPCSLMEASIGCAEGANTSYDANQDQFTITSDGCFDYPGESIAFTGTRLCGDSEIVIHLEDVEGSGYAGILMRESLDPGSRMVGIASDLSRDVRAEYRVTTDGNLFRSVKRRTGAEWFKIVRTGDKFMSYTSTNGSDWRLLRTTNFDNMAECMYVGIQAYSINGNAIFTATIDEFTVTGANSSNLERTETTPETTPLHVIMQEKKTGSEYDLSIAPNPFSPETRISFNLDKTAEVSLTLFDLQGQIVKQLTKGQFEPGLHQNQWDGSNEAGTQLPSGLYLVQLQIGSEIISKTVILQR